MKHVAFVFPGQGSQYVGMGREFAENFQSAASVFETSRAVLQVDIPEICFNGPEEMLVRTEITQPAILTVSLAAFAVLSEMGIHPSFVAGHSLGEYSALTAAGTFTLPDALKVVARRGKLMAEAVPEGKGSMAAVMGLESETVKEVCFSVSPSGDVAPANFNCPGQIVISGTKEAVEAAAAALKEKGAKRVLPLSVSGPFHSRLMDSVRGELEDFLDTISLVKPRYSFVPNTTASQMEDIEEIKRSLIEQVKSPVLWQQSVEYLIARGANIFVEVGPGRVLSGLIKKVDKSVHVLNVEDCRTLEEAVGFLKGVEKDA